MIKESLEKRYSDDSLSDEEKKKYERVILIKKLLLEALYLFIVIFSFVKIHRNVIFFRVLGGTYKIYIVAMVLFYVAMYFIIVYNTILLGYIAYNKWKKKEWLPLLHKLNVKLDIYTFIAKCLSILLFIMIYITTPCTIVGPSMMNTFQDGEKVMCSDVFYTPKVNDVVIFDASNYTNADNFYIKRVIGVSGMTFSIEDNKVSIDGEEYSDISKSQFNTIKKSAGIEEDVTSFVIPENMVFVMGDNRDHSLDSRAFGLVSIDDIFGKVYLRIFPFKSISVNFERKEV